MNIVVFDIETIPDTQAGATLYDIAALSETEIADAMFAKQRATTGNDFLPHYCQKIIAISVAVRTSNTFKIYSLGEPDSCEKDIITLFFQGIERLTPTLISWNGTSFDCPVLHYRALLHGISAPRYWETGNEDQSFRWNNYLNRYHDRHLDLMDVLAGYTGRANAPLDKIASLLGFPGKMGMSGENVWPYYQAGKIVEIRDYCETDVLNTYLVYLRFQQLRGKLFADQLNVEYDLIRASLAESNKNHFREFLNAWAI